MVNEIFIYENSQIGPTYCQMQAREIKPPSDVRVRRRTLMPISLLNNINDDERASH